MSSESWARVKQIVAEALELSGAERARFIEARCAGDEGVLSEVRSLVAASDSSTAVLSLRTDAWLGYAGPEEIDLSNQRIGRYLLRRKIAESPSALIYLAAQENPERQVVVKLLRSPLPVPEVTERFRIEASALGRIEHPNVARIYEAGVHRSGLGAPIAYIAMEYVEGVPITQHARESALSREAIVRLMIKVAHAVHAAHQRAVIHRDLKPANVLVDQSGEPRVLDFGIARITSPDREAPTALTHAGSLLGTPGYMPPEQVSGRPDGADVRTDVWALGAILYELLTGRLPIDVAGLGLLESIARIGSAEPLPPSKLDPSLRGDLDAIVMTAIAREKHRRYASAEALALDLERWLRHEPVAARTPTLSYRAASFARRHRAGVAIAAVAIGAATLGTIALSVAFVRSERERARADAANALLRTLITSADPAFGDRDATMLSVLDNAEARIDGESGLHPLVEADVRSSLGSMRFGLGDYDRAREQLERAISLRERAGEGRSRAALEDRARLVNALRWLYRAADAESLAESLVREATARFGPRDRVTIFAREVRAGCMQDREDLAGAETELRDLASLCERTLGPSSEQTLAVQGQLASVLMASGAYAESEAIQRRVLAARQRATGANKLETLTIRANIAALMGEQGQTAAAADALRVLHADAVNAIGPVHELSLTIGSNLTEMLMRLGRGEEAAVSSEARLARCVEELGWGHARTQSEAAALGSLRLRLGQHDAALELAHRAGSEAAQALGTESQWYHRQRQNQAAALSASGRFDESEAIYTQTIDFYRGTFGPDHQLTLGASNNYGLMLVERGDGARAESLLRDTLARAMASGFAPMEPVVRRNLGRALDLLDRDDEALAELERAHALSIERGEQEHASKAAQALAAFFEKRGRASEAGAWRGRVPGTGSRGTGSP
ncbi:MAG: tetratricopeptide repeat protein [Phycisphaeraceae bacterium]|nr:tetratricopeptide repeat protein [Phycisphaeraceae bacterium]MBX3368241.1 tetratricopeptide repeat protein [Phycisphaeraceae bacterium]